MFTMFQDRHLIRHEHNYTHEQDKVEYKDENTTEQGNASEPDPEAYLLMRERKILENKLKLAEMFKTSILDKSFDSESSISSSNASSTASLSLPSSPTQSTKVPSLRRSLTRSNPSEDPIFYSARHVDEQQERHLVMSKYQGGRHGDCELLEAMNW
ncbi:hypothetical protein BGZ76_001014 [Entomortierella beljakovae]|nr:hypothetical protein BGZ76_001014 [Entomortierella beljakovae]